MNLDVCDRIFEEALNSTTESAFCHAIVPLFEYYKILSVGLSRGNIFWRARTIKSKPFENLSDMYYPPSSLTAVGRLNDAGSPCFYIAQVKETAIVEVDAKEGQLVQLAGFRVLDCNPVRLSVIGEYSNVQKAGYMHFLGDDPDMTISKILNSMPLHAALRTIYIDKFFAYVLADPEAGRKNYMMSRALTQLIYARIKADGLVFPSVKDRGGFNIGIRPVSSDKCFHNVCCLVVRLGKKRRFGLLDFEVVKSAKMLDSNQNFIWDDSLKIDKFGMYGMSKEEYEFAKINTGDRNALLNVLHRNRLKKQGTQ